MIPDRVMDRLWINVAVGDWDACWPWLRSTGSHGYGQIGWSDKGIADLVLTHRLAYELAYGLIPDAMTVDHECRFRRCCNPIHLRLMTNVDNATSNGNKIKTKCKRGHAFTVENTRTNARGHRWCRQCGRDRKRGLINA